MKRIYLIPGLATDERLFSKLHLENAELIALRWEIPLKNDTLASYAKRLVDQIDSSKPFYLLGVSFGGMCAVEISKFLKPIKIIIVSSAKGADELPFFIRIFKYIPLHFLFSQSMFILFSKFIKHFLATHAKDDRNLLLDMLQKTPEKYIQRAIHCIVTWDRLSVTSNSVHIVHIHGTTDRVIPIRNLKNVIAVKGGNHFMVLNRAGEISEMINRELR